MVKVFTVGLALVTFNPACGPAWTTLSLTVTFAPLSSVSSKHELLGNLSAFSAHTFAPLTRPPVFSVMNDSKSTTLEDLEVEEEERKGGTATAAAVPPPPADAVVVEVPKLKPGTGVVAVAVAPGVAVVVLPVAVVVFRPKLNPAAGAGPAPAASAAGGAVAALVPN